MKREIRFKAKSKETGEWVLGMPIYKPFEDKCFMFPPQGICGSTGVEVDPDTVSQYTGRKDRYGKEIYEGDILDFYDDECGKPGNLCGARLEIKWNKEESRFGYQNHVEGHEYVSGFKRLWDEDTYVIIGNIYDNPELLDGEND